ncbi:MAG TPA: efflux RND transporter periplasmic adaptor subunit [Thermoanaerobaculia bacterium]|nr:efflux RND transporter periplasmic adaptor subunit [Thermoanaerobaculia bacterium]
MKIQDRYKALSPRGKRIAAITATVAVVAILAIAFANPLVAWFTMKPMGGSAAKGVVVKSGDLTFEASMNPDPPRRSDNTMIVRITDSEGKPVEADVEVEYVMPAMGAMAEMRGKADIDQKRGGVYHARFDLPMGGSWTMSVRARTNEGSAEARYTLTVGTKGLVAAGGSGGAASPLPPQQFPPGVLTELRRALGAYEQARAMLANDRLDGIATHANALAAAFTAARPSTGDEVRQCLLDGTAAARKLAAATSLDAARAAFKDVSMYLFALAASDPRLASGWHAYECSMTDGFNKWLQNEEGVSNPYMGTAMQTCGSPTAIAPVALSAHDPADGDETAYYTCSMHPSVRQEGPGQCPICGMDLTPVSQEEVSSGIIRIDEDRRQQIGIKTAFVISRPMDTAIRAVGKTAFDESRVRDVTLKLDGFVERLYVNKTGDFVRRGQALLTLYSPELYAAQQDYLLALRSQRASRASGAPDRADYLVRAARERLRLWDLSNGQINQIASTGRPIERMPIHSPYSGFVVEKKIVEGSSVRAGETLFRIAALDRVWVEADVYEKDLGAIRAGQTARVTLPYVAGRTFDGRITYVYPYLDASTRTGKVRIELPNPNLELKPEMYADVEIRAAGKIALTVPEDAVLITGPRQLVFLDLGEGRLKPQAVQVGKRSNGYYEILSGLKEGDLVIASANFLVASESRIRSAAQFWGGEE